jgi:hypothetical protein
VGAVSGGGVAAGAGFGFSLIHPPGVNPNRKSRLCRRRQLDLPPRVRVKRTVADHRTLGTALEGECSDYEPGKRHAHLQDQLSCQLCLGTEVNYVVQQVRACIAGGWRWSTNDERSATLGEEVTNGYFTYELTVC